MKDDLTLGKYDGQRGLSELYDEWLLLMEEVRDTCFYHHPDWFQAYFASRERIDPPISLFIVRRGDRLVAVIPLQRKLGRRLWQATQLLMPFESQLYMPDCAIAASEDPAEVLSFFLDTVHREYGWSWDRFTVRQALESSLISIALRGLSGRRLLARTTGTCSVVPVQPYDELLKRMKAKYRQNLNRSKRMIAALDDVEFSVVTESEDVMRTFEEFVELEASGWKGGKGSPRGDVLKPLAIALSEKKRRFYEVAIRAFAARGAVEIFCLRAEGRLIGAEVWLMLGDTCFAMKTAYDESFSRISPGVMAFDLGYQHHAAAGDAAIINTITSTPAVEDWLPDNLRVQDLDLFNSTFRGRLFAAALTIRKLFGPRSDDN